MSRNLHSNHAKSEKIVVSFFNLIPLFLMVFCALNTCFNHIIKEKVYSYVNESENVHEENTSLNVDNYIFIQEGSTSNVMVLSTQRSIYPEEIEESVYLKCDSELFYQISIEQLEDNADLCLSVEEGNIIADILDYDNVSIEIIDRDVNFIFYDDYWYIKDITLCNALSSICECRFIRVYQVGQMQYNQFYLLESVVVPGIEINYNDYSLSQRILVNINDYAFKGFESAFNGSLYKPFNGFMNALNVENTTSMYMCMKVFYSYCIYLFLIDLIWLLYYLITFIPKSALEFIERKR